MGTISLSLALYGRDSILNSQASGLRAFRGLSVRVAQARKLPLTLRTSSMIVTRNLRSIVSHNEEYVAEVLKEVGLLTQRQIEQARVKAGAGSVLR